MSCAACSEARTWEARQAAGASRPVCSQAKNISTRSRDMDHSAEEAAASPEVPQELLEEMVWVFRVEDGR